MAEDQNNVASGQPDQQPQQPYGAPQQPPVGQPYGHQQQPYGAPQQPYSAPQPPYQQGAPMMHPQPLQALTGGMKAAWLFASFLLGPAGILIAWLVNVDKFPQVKKDALKWSIIGAVISIAFNFLYMSLVFGGMLGLAGAGISASSFSW